MSTIFLWIKNKIIPNVSITVYIYMCITFGIVAACSFCPRYRNIERVVKNEARFGKLEKNDMPQKLKFYTPRKKINSFCMHFKNDLH